jgi:drug/metabolite transporter (DMT)-like permease
LSTATITGAATVASADRRRKGLLIVVGCTLIGATAQVLIKSGANHLSHPGFVAALVGMLTNPPLFFGYCLYGVFTALMVYALRDGELSILFPLIALQYVWVSILSVVIFHEAMSPLKGAGVVTIVIGVAVLGRGGAKA